MCTWPGSATSHFELANPSWEVSRIGVADAIFLFKSCCYGPSGGNISDFRGVYGQSRCLNHLQANLIACWTCWSVRLASETVFLKTRNSVKANANLTCGQQVANVITKARPLGAPFAFSPLLKRGGEELFRRSTHRLLL